MAAGPEAATCDIHVCPHGGKSSYPKRKESEGNQLLTNVFQKKGEHSWQIQAKHQQFSLNVGTVADVCLHWQREHQLLSASELQWDITSYLSTLTPGNTLMFQTQSGAVAGPSSWGSLIMKALMIPRTTSVCSSLTWKRRHGGTWWMHHHRSMCTAVSSIHLKTIFKDGTRTGRGPSETANVPCRPQDLVLRPCWEVPLLMELG